MNQKPKRKNGIYICVYKHNKTYDTHICTTIDMERQREEGKQISRRTGANQVYWFQRFPFSMDKNNEEVISYAIKNGYLVYSDARD